MLNKAKISQHIDEENYQHERRNSADRRKSNEKTRFPFIDEDCKLVMKDRRVSDRRTPNMKVSSSSLKVVSKLFRK